VPTAAKTPTASVPVPDVVEGVHTATRGIVTSPSSSMVGDSVDRVKRTVVDIVPGEAKKELARVVDNLPADRVLPLDRVASVLPKAAAAVTPILNRVTTAPVPFLKGIAPGGIGSAGIPTPKGVTVASILISPILPAAAVPTLYPAAGLTPAFPAPLPGMDALMAPFAVVAGTTIVAPLDERGANRVLSAFAQHRAAGFPVQLEASPASEVAAASAGTGARGLGGDRREPALPPAFPLAAPGPTTAPGGFGGSNFIPLVALMALVALSAPTFRRRSGVTSAFWPPTPFLCAFERPG
jgi:hypothetical protein